MRDTVTPGAGRYDTYSYRPWTDDELFGPLPARPSFEPDLDTLRATCLGQVEKVSVPRDLTRPHYAVAKLLEVDEQRRVAQLGKTYVSSWDAPRFISPFEQRRLRVLSGLMIAIGRAGCDVKLSGKNARGIFVSVYDTPLWLRLDDEAGMVKSPDEYAPPKAAAGSPLILGIVEGHDGPPVKRWFDDGSGKLETKLREAVAEVLVHAEAGYRTSCERRHQWRIERRADRLEELHLARRKAEQAERERVEQLKQDRITSLLAEAEAFKKAETIRSYVANACNAATDLPAEDIAAWAQWALAVASSIDPVESGSFLRNAIRDS